MEHVTKIVAPVSTPAYPLVVAQVPSATAADASRVLRNTCALLAMTLLFSATIAAASVTLTLPAPGILLTLAGYFGLLFVVYKLKNSVWALPAVFALTGFMGYTLGPMLSKSLSLPGGAQLGTLALATTGVTFLALPTLVLNTRRDVRFMGGFLFAGIVKVLRSTTARSAGACGWIAANSTNCSNAPQYRHQGAIPLQVQTAISRILTSAARQDIARDTGNPG